MHTKVMALLVGWFLSFVSIDVSASMQMARLNEVKRGELLLPGPTEGSRQLAQMLSTDVVINVTGPTVRTHLVQRFKNPGQRWTNGTYAFPLPEDAAVDHLKMVIGERIIEGVIQEKQQARKTFEEAKASGKKASLVEQVRPNLFTTDVANIGPEEVVEIRLEYQQLLEWRDGIFKIRYPMAFTPRYIPREMLLGGGVAEIIEINQGWGAQSSNESVQGGKGRNEEEKNENLSMRSLQVNLNVGFPIKQLESRYHKVNTEVDGESKRIITLDPFERESKHDFVLQWLPVTGHEPRAAFFTDNSSGTDHHGLLMVMPPEKSEFIEPQPREITYVIDTSGSMSGPSINQAKLALQKAMTRLTPQDRFNIIQFDDEASALFQEPWEASDQTIAMARDYIRRLHADGGTEMQSALTLALLKNIIGSDDRLRQVVFITDGAVGNEEKLFNFIHHNILDRRLFTVGIGGAPNSYFMRKAAEIGRGTFTYIGDASEVEEKMDQLLIKMEQPALTDLSIHFDGVEDQSLQVIPEKIPDLYMGDPIIVSTRSGQLPDHATLQGRFNGQPWSAKIKLSGGSKQGGVATLFGRRMIESWMDRKAIGEREEDVRAAVIQLAHRYHLVSQYTSLVAVDVTSVDVLKKLEQQVIDKGGDPTILKMASTSTDLTLKMLLGIVLLLLSLLLVYPSRNRLAR